MENFAEKRKERRLNYQWPVWFAEDFDRELAQGQMVDVSSEGAAFTCYTDHNCPYHGQNITARFSVPKFETDDSFGLTSFIRQARVCRIDNVNEHLRKIAIQFADPLPFRPGEQAESETGAGQYCRILHRRMAGQNADRSAGQFRMVRIRDCQLRQSARC